MPGCDQQSRRLSFLLLLLLLLHKLHVVLQVHSSKHRCRLQSMLGQQLLPLLLLLLAHVEVCWKL